MFATLIYSRLRHRSIKMNRLEGKLVKSRRNLFPVKDSRKSMPPAQPNFLTIQHKDESFQTKQEHEQSRTRTSGGELQRKRKDFLPTSTLQVVPSCVVFLLFISKRPLLFELVSRMVCWLFFEHYKSRWKNIEKQMIRKTIQTLNKRKTTKYE